MINYLKEHEIIILPLLVFLLCLTNLPLLACGLSGIGLYLARFRARNVDSRLVRGIQYLLMLFYTVIFLLNFIVLFDAIRQIL